MKMKKLLSILSLPFLLSSCSIFIPRRESNSDASEITSKEEPSDYPISEDTSEDNTSSHEDSTSSVENKTLKSITKNYIKIAYYTGDIYKDAVEARIKVNYTDGTSEIISSGFELSVTSFTSQDGYECSSTTPILRAGKYTSKVKITYQLNSVTKTITPTETNTVYSVLESNNDECIALEATMLNSYAKNEKVLDKLNIQLDITWKEHGKELYILKEENSNIQLVLHSDAQPDTNIIDNGLLGGTNYHLILTIGETSDTIDFTLASAYIRVDKSELTMTAHEVSDSNSPIVENPKILVIPVNLNSDDSSNINDWTSSSVATLRDYYFGSSALSFQNYYNSMSLGYMNFSGMVADIYEENGASYTVEKINNDSSYTALYTMMNRALKSTMDNNPDVDWSEYDQDNNGTFDNIHILTNYNANTWAGPLWPHMSSIGNTGTHSSPAIDTYSIGAINHTDSAITQIHEQGHVFGLLDYYDYSNNGSSNINYVGGADMQSHNMFDWNSYSKLSVGLLSPYVITGTEDDFTITINDAVTSGDCILVPADYSTWNGSAYDEYFLIELFSNKGLNNQFWDTYSYYYGNLGNYGIRMYHVDSRLYDLETGHEVSLDKSTWGNYIEIGPNNSSDYTATGYGEYNPSECADMKLLTIIQAGGTDTFGGTQSNNHYLTNDDMFQTGDTFTFSEYSHFLSKAGNSKTKMDNGETFSWKIDFESVTLDSATLRFYK